MQLNIFTKYQQHFNRTVCHKILLRHVHGHGMEFCIDIILLVAICPWG